MPISRSRFACGDVVIVPFPYSDQLAEKRRPALVVSNYQVAGAGFVWIAMITSATHSALPTDYVIEDLNTAGLLVPSIVRPLKIACIEPARIVRRAGALNARATRAICERIQSFVGD